MDASGVMLTGWQKVGGTWYYLKGSGAMAEGWAKVGGKWYYLRPGSGAMATLAERRRRVVLSQGVWCHGDGQASWLVERRIRSTNQARCFRFEGHSVRSLGTLGLSRSAERF